ncbi:hypothetical protein GCM10011409_28540 [Lentibacillus populi]|uniref:Uncharacterized protein n=1 Tax=Lentibacillus populi TaxID=1827502 RepID=A0A9W5TYW5_9BACI|nr:hypothetical protein GCM10011409_28540 [Lentibacillus populi]
MSKIRGLIRKYQEDDVDALISYKNKLPLVATKYLDNYLYWFRWLDLGKDLAFDKRVEQMLISACQKSNYATVEIYRTAKKRP